MKRQLFETWLAPFLPQYVVTVARQGEAPPRAVEALRLQRLPQGDPRKEYIYILLADVEVTQTPVYVGRAKDPVARWEQHLDGLHKGQKSYGKWRQLLMTEEGLVKHSLRLAVLPVSDIPRAPLPNFPVTVGAVEYQLISIAGDAYPGWLLNHEGNRR